MAFIKEIGGYFELECENNPPYHPNAYRLNSFCSGLRLLIRSLNIKELYVSEYTCPVVWNAIRSEDCICNFYKTGLDFLPTKPFRTNDYIIYNNYFGVCALKTQKLAKDYPNIIIDNAQAFYMPPVGLASIYSLHKFFGVPDGGLLYSNHKIEMPNIQSESWNICSHLLKRHDLNAADGYEDFKNAGKWITQSDVCLMSRLTTALMGNINYEKAKEKRIQNFSYLHNRLCQINQLNLNLSRFDVPMVYPLLPENGSADLRKKLIDSKIYVAQYWPGISQHKFLDIIPLPIDQRYGVSEMEQIVYTVKKAVSNG
jgi:hypothetical protein